MEDRKKKILRITGVVFAAAALSLLLASGFKKHCYSPQGLRFFLELDGTKESLQMIANVNIAFSDIVSAAVLLPDDSGAARRSVGIDDFRGQRRSLFSAGTECRGKLNSAVPFRSGEYILRLHDRKGRDIEIKTRWQRKKIKAPEHMEYKNGVFTWPASDSALGYIVKIYDHTGRIVLESPPLLKGSDRGIFILGKNALECPGEEYKVRIYAYDAFYESASGLEDRIASCLRISPEFKFIWEAERPKIFYWKIKRNYYEDVRGGYGLVSLMDVFVTGSEDLRSLEIVDPRGKIHRPRFNRYLSGYRVEAADLPAGNYYLRVCWKSGWREKIFLDVPEQMPDMPEKLVFDRTTSSLKWQAGGNEDYFRVNLFSEDRRGLCFLSGTVLTDEPRIELPSPAGYYGRTGLCAEVFATKRFDQDNGTVEISAVSGKYFFNYDK